jgi:hypothetical protein
MIRVPLRCPKCANRDDTELGTMPCSAECGSAMELDAGIRLNKAELGLVVDLLLEKVVAGGMTYEVIVTGERADAGELLARLLEERLGPVQRTQRF